MEKNKNSWCWR